MKSKVENFFNNLNQNQVNLDLFIQINDFSMNFDEISLIFSNILKFRFHKNCFVSKIYFICLR
jgi:hypothetical protein